MARRVSLLVLLPLWLACGAGATALDGQHKSLDAVVGKCRILGGGTAFYVCPPFAGTLPIGDGSVSAPLHWTLSGRAASSNGRRSFDDTHGVAQVLLRNGWPFGADSGVVVTGHVVPHSLVFASFWTKPTLVSGYAVWRLPHGAAKLRLETGHGGHTVFLVVDGQLLPPTAVIPPASLLHSAALARLFRSNMRHLAVVADGDVAGACSFYRRSLHMSDDQHCADALGLSGKAAAVLASVGSARILSYNGWTLVESTINGQNLPWVLDAGTFRIAYGYRLS
jgi:hypothetical protein